MSEVQIQCPECDEKFVVPEELVGFPVECGACGHPFDLAEDHVVDSLKRSYPGEQADKLAGFTRKSIDTKMADEVSFQTVTYDESVTHNDIMPRDGFGKALVALGLVILLGVTLYFITQHRSPSYGAMSAEKLWLLSGFFSMIGSFMILFGVRRFHVVDYVVTVVVGGMTCMLPLWFPYEGASEEEIAAAVQPLVEEEPGFIEDEKTRRYKEGLGYDAVANQIANAANPDQVVAIALLGAKPVHIDVIRKYLGHVMRTEEVPRTYKNRMVNGMNTTLLVFTQSQVNLKDVATAAPKFGEVVAVRDDLKVVDVRVNTSLLTMSDSDILVDPEHPSFHAVNLRELKHIDPERQEMAVQRFINVNKIRLRADVAQQLLSMLQDPYCEFKEEVVMALNRWDDDEGGARDEVAKQARELAVMQKEIPKSYLVYLVEQDVQRIGDIIVYAWMNDRIANEALLLNAGSRAEDALLQVFNDLDISAQRSASIVLRKVGSEASLKVLVPAYQAAEGDLKTSLKATIDEIQSRR